MNATVALTGQGGWPMTCFLTPTAGRSSAARTTRSRTRSCSRPSARPGAPARRGRTGLGSDRRPAVDGAGCRRAGRRCSRRFATAVAACCATRTPRGGSAAPKFPPSALLEALLRPRAHRDVLPLEAVERTCTAMARGGIYDQLAGGSPATASTRPGWCRISRRCSTTTRCCSGFMHTGRGDPKPVGAGFRETARFMIDDLGAAACSPRHWTPTPTARKASRTSTHSCARCSAMTTAVGPQRFSMSPSRDLRTRQFGAAAAGRPRRPGPIRGGADRCWPPG